MFYTVVTTVITKTAKPLIAFFDFNTLRKMKSGLVGDKRTRIRVDFIPGGYQHRLGRRC